MHSRWASLLTICSPGRAAAPGARRPHSSSGQHLASWWHSREPKPWGHAPLPAPAAPPAPPAGGNRLPCAGPALWCRLPRCPARRWPESHLCVLPCAGPWRQEVQGSWEHPSSLRGAFVLLVRSAHHHLIENMEGNVRHVLTYQFQMDFLSLNFLDWKKTGFSQLA